MQNLKMPARCQDVHACSLKSCASCILLKSIFQLVHIIKIGGVCGRVVNTLNSGPGGPGFKPRPSPFYLRQGTLLHFVSLHLGV